MIACILIFSPVHFLWRLFDLSYTGYFYTYSALAQSMAALLGILGIFGVYRLQIQYDRISNLCRETKEFFTDADPKNAPTIRALTRNQLFEYPKKSITFNDYGAEVTRREAEIKAEESRREDIKQNFMLSAIPFAGITVVSLIFTGQSEYWANHDVIGPLVMALMFLFVIVSMSLMLWFAYLCLKGE